MVNKTELRSWLNISSPDTIGVAGSRKLKQLGIVQTSGKRRVKEEYFEWETSGEVPSWKIMDEMIRPIAGRPKEVGWFI